MSFDDLRRRHLRSCFYCGEPADTKDHFHCVKHGGSRKTGKWVPACRQCNCQILRDSPISDLKVRALLVANWLERKYQSSPTYKNNLTKFRIEWAREIANS